MYRMRERARRTRGKVELEKYESSVAFFSRCLLSAFESVLRNERKRNKGAKERERENVDDTLLECRMPSSPGRCVLCERFNEGKRLISDEFHESGKDFNFAMQRTGRGRGDFNGGAFARRSAVVLTHFVCELSLVLFSREGNLY